MMRLTRKTTIALTPRYSVVIDAEDESRIRERQWKLFESDQIIPYTMHGDVQIPLANLITGTPPTVYVQKLDGRHSNNFTKKNLKVGR